MPVQAAISVQNNFKNGLITEATELNFPENACTDTNNCEFNFDGSVVRRLGFDFEANFTTKTINRTDCAISTYLWRNVAGDGNTTLFVTQVGATLYFYKTSLSSFSLGAVSSTVTLTAVSGAPSPAAIEAQYSDGNGLLFITHPYCEPMYVSYNTSTDTATATNITLKIRDFEGATADSNPIDTRPTATLAGLDANHKYNLYNQGWNTTNLTAWDTSQTTMPSNADVMWRFKNSSDAFDMATLANVIAGNTPAPKGHFILTLSNQDRDTAAGTSGVTATTTGSQRPSTSAFFAGRVFWAGINYTGFNSKIYFTQIVERSEQYGFCYQLNDPTAEDTFDLLPADGGVISIPEAGTIFKLFSVPGGLAVFAANGVWFITGSTGIGFTATDYTVQKIAKIATISASSFVDVQGFPAWWNAEGIYMMSSPSGATMPTVSALTYTTIKEFYDGIPLNAKKYARGFYDFIDGHVHWLYKSEDTSQLTNVYEFDNMLNLNVRTGAFYPWTNTDTNVKLNGIVVTDAISGAVSVDNVIDGSGNTVIDGSSNQVITFTTSGISSAALTVKFLVSYVDSGSYKFTFAENKDTNYLDWFSYDTIGEDFTSYFISGYQLRGSGLNKFQSNWVKIFSDMDLEESSYYVQGLWDYALTGSGTGRWSSRQKVDHTNTDYAAAGRRLKVRGHGVVLQLKVTSVPSKPFKLIGWTTFDTANSIP